MIALYHYPVASLQEQLEHGRDGQFFKPVKSTVDDKRAPTENI